MVHAHLQAAEAVMVHTHLRVAAANRPPFVFVDPARVGNARFYGAPLAASVACWSVSGFFVLVRDT